MAELFCLDINLAPKFGGVQPTIIIGHFVLAATLFKLVNWVGEHATDFGYASTTLFEEPNDSLALNFLIRALAPTVFIVALSAAAVAADYPDLRLGILWIVILYYLLRFIYIFAVNKQLLVNWIQFFFQSSVGLAAAYFAYKYLIIPNISLLPDLKTAGNELWLGIFGFIYAVANKVTVSGAKGARRRNKFIEKSYNQVKILYGSRISNANIDDELQLIIYSILIYENYCRPPFIRFLERLCFWKHNRTTGIMQVASSKSLTDEESVELGLKKLSASWKTFSSEKVEERTRNTIADYNKDDDYIFRVMDVMEIIAKRVAPDFLQAYKRISQN